MNGASEFSDSKYLIVWVSFQSKKAPKNKFCDYNFKCFLVVYCNALFVS